MATRLHRLGNIYSRVDGLIRKGHFKEKDIPIWFDVYKSFPPKYEPTFKRRAPDVTVKEIFYKEDVLRAKLQKALPNRLGLIDLNSDAELLSEKMLKNCQQYISEGMSEEKAIEKVELSVRDKQESQKEIQSKEKVEKLLEDIL